MSKNNCCPKCGTKLSPFYMKQNCPNCDVNLLYYRMDERLASDAKNAEREVNAVKRFLLMLKASTIGDVWHIVRLVTFFLPLATMCLPVYWAGYKNVSLITFIMNIVNHGFDLLSWRLDYMVAVFAIILVIVLSLVEIINSLFSSTKKGYRRDMIFSLINTAVFGLLSTYACKNGAQVRAGFYLTMLVYVAVFILHYVVAKPKTSNKKKVVAVSVVLCVLLCNSAAILSSDKPEPTPFVSNYDSDIKVVSFNVASAFGTSFEDTDSMDRCERFVKYMDDVRPNVIGTQEINSYWYDYIDKNLDGYVIYGEKRGGDSTEANSEMNAIIYLDVYKEVEKGTFWLSDTPDVESKYSYVDEKGDTVEAGCNRICTYAVLESDETGKLLFMNTHLDNSSEQARIFGVGVILDKMNELKDKYGEDIHIVLTGDFNEYLSDKACQQVAGVLNTTLYEPLRNCTYQEWGYRDTSDEPIDFIFTTGTADEYRVLDDLSNGYISDHYGVYSSITY